MNKPCVVFIDEIDAIGAKRAEAGVRANEEREQTLNQLLTEIDGFSPMESVVVIAATNRPDLLDPALLRAGRLERKIFVNKPDNQGRKAIHSVKYKLSPEINLAQLARDTPGFSPAELANLMNEAGIETIRRFSDTRHAPSITVGITDDDCYRALDRLRYGLKKYPLCSDSWRRNLYAGNEAGKALVASVLRTCGWRIEKIGKISVALCGRNHSFTDFARSDDLNNQFTTRGKMIDRLKIACAARAAEQELLDVIQPKQHLVWDLLYNLLIKWSFSWD